VAQHDDLKLPLTATADKHANENAQEPVEQRHQHEAQSEPAAPRSTSRPVPGRIDFLYPTPFRAMNDLPDHRRRSPESRNRTTRNRVHSTGKLNGR
jgi:hypothetical protein